MITKPSFRQGQQRRERAAKGAFLIWMAGYAVILLAIAAAHSFSGSVTGIKLDTKGVHSLQAKMTGEPQSSISGQLLPGIIVVDDKG